MFRRILVAWDGSRPARRALDLAIDLARRYDAEVLAASVAHSPTHAETEADRVESVEASRKHFEETFERVRDRAERVGVPMEHVIVEGDEPAEDLVRFAHEHGVDLIVAGRHQDGRTGRFLLRELVPKLIASADVPVLIAEAPIENR
jgi:nucleotide-binding universal stress UspA family protein